MASFPTAGSEAVDPRLMRGLAFGLLLVAPFWAAFATALWLALR